ncbi:TetR family transcriptional regulator [Nonomuraea phyllanthi]|uniref:TetR family transcriptional regulator n=1 Tax=Nonomuraea phyllanthi TaxID=2219224 RepID=A0A5C4VS25_9ACTN|nr:TetR/AcrR family transcriptional regulator [Nonomuraea phyllanthi]KAB8189785.1 TetR family transcriptional regulator [Nonomuraea phyllanthi]QFY08740.1 TetR family transcriptional regulator [Nonomuraea phyllanthi]
MAKTAARQPVPARRADAERNIAAILEAGMRLLSADPTASVADIAKAAGVGRVTLYGHFPSREALVDAVLDHAVGVADAVLADDSLDTEPAPEAMARLLRSSWEVLDRHRRLFLAADRVLPTERIREHHEAPLRRVERLIARGRHEGDFRTDLPLGWLVTTFFSIIHSAAQEREAGRLGAVEVEPVLVTTMLSLLTANG